MAELIQVDDKYREKLFDEFVSSLPDYFKTTEHLLQIRTAYDFAFKAHINQRRKCGDHEPYIVHLVAVAKIVANEIGLGVSSVVAALLHDVVEDTEFERIDIERKFGPKIADIVDGLTKITNIYNHKDSIQAESFKKMILSIPHDHRVAFIKLAYRLHNMRTMDEMPDSTRQIKANENLYVYVKIAGQLGLYDIKNEIENLSFKYLHPKKYEDMSVKVAETSLERSTRINKLKLELIKILTKTNKLCKFSTVRRSLYEIWTSMQQQGCIKKVGTRSA